MSKSGNTDKRLGFDFYGETFNPQQVPKGSAVCVSKVSPTEYNATDQNHGSAGRMPKSEVARDKSVSGKIQRKDFLSLFHHKVLL